MNNTFSIDLKLKLIKSILIVLETILIRKKTKADEDFIFHSWLTHYQANSYFAKRIDKQTFMQNHSIILNMLMTRPTTEVMIAGDEDFTIFGYIVAEDLQSDSPVIHFCYIRPEFQRLGIGKKLVESLGPKTFEISHWTPVMNEITRSNKQFKYNPYRM